MMMMVGLMFPAAGADAVVTVKVAARVKKEEEVEAADV